MAVALVERGTSKLAWEDKRELTQAQYALAEARVFTALPLNRLLGGRLPAAFVSDITSMGATQPSLIVF